MDYREYKFIICRISSLSTTYILGLKKVAGKELLFQKPAQFSDFPLHIMKFMNYMLIQFGRISTAARTRVQFSLSRQVTWLLSPGIPYWSLRLGPGILPAVP